LFGKTIYVAEFLEKQEIVALTFFMGADVWMSRILLPVKPL